MSGLFFIAIGAALTLFVLGKFAYTLAAGLPVAGVLVLVVVGLLVLGVSVMTVGWWLA